MSSAVARRRHVLPGFTLTLGVTLLYTALIILLPLAALVYQASGLGLDRFIAIVASERALATYAVTVGAAAAATVFNGAFGLLLAWVLVRYRFPGRRLIDALVDLPFALPTAVAGLALTTLLAPNGWLGAPLAALDVTVVFTWVGIAIAMAFTSLPFVVRTVQPVLEDIETEVEEAAASLGASRAQTFRRVIVPFIAPSFLAGIALAFARSLGEFGAVIFIAGNMPMKTEITALLIFIRLEEFNYGGAAAIATVLLAFAFLMLGVTNAIQAWQLRYVQR